MRSAALDRRWLLDGELAESLPDCIAVAWSGGIDSTALLLLLHELGFHVQAWHVDHAWHEASAADADMLRCRATSWDIPFYSRRLSTVTMSNREAHARHGRYLAFQSIANQTKVYDVALAHHGDDQAETVCMRMLQGSGVMGLRGMQSQSAIHGLRLYRPLLHVRRHALLLALQQAGIPWLEDRSNRDLQLWRNRIRLQLLPAMQAEGVEPYQLWTRWQRQAKRIADLVEAGIASVDIKKTADECFVEWGVWRDLQQPMRVQVLQRMAGMLLGKGTVLGRRHLELVECWRKKGGRSGVDLSGCRLYRLCEGLHLQARAAISRP